MHHQEPSGRGALSDFETEYQAVQDLSDDEFCKRFGIRILVAGSRGINDYPTFCKWIERSVLFEIIKENGCFISGTARGPDAMIIRWCKENEILCRECPADWDTHGKKAGYLRNASMAEITTQAIIFWDGLSKGTKNMIDLCKRKEIELLTIVLDSDETLPTAVAEKQRERKALEYRSASQALLDWSPETD